MKFIRVGDTLINLDAVTHIEFGDDIVSVYLRGTQGHIYPNEYDHTEGNFEQPELRFRGAECEAIRRYFSGELEGGNDRGLRVDVLLPATDRQGVPA